MAFDLLDTCYVAILDQGLGIPKEGVTTSTQTGVEGFYATLCTAGVTVFCLDPNDDYGSSFYSGDIILVERTSDSSVLCATAGSTNIDISDGYEYSANFDDADCAACIANGYGS